jgi:hypothetical protein
MASEKNPGDVQDVENGHVSPDGGSGEKKRQWSIGHVSENREDDFLTRNGLNLRSFQRREFAFAMYRVVSRDLTEPQELMMDRVWLTSIAP